MLFSLVFVYLYKITKMANPTTFNYTESLRVLREKENEIYTLENRLSALLFEAQELRRKNADNITIQWKEAIKNCLAIDNNAPQFPQYFLKTPAFISDCVAWTNGVEISRDIKNKIASTLSFMFKEGSVGRIQHNGKTYYGLAQYFNKDLTTIKKEYQRHISQLAA